MVLTKIILFHIHSWFGRGENSPLENHVTDWIKKGATWIGGCCRIKPRDIKSLEERIRNID